MNQNRNRNIDCFRALALLQVMFYHAWVLTGSRQFSSVLVTQFVSLGGEIGVTAFFALSGYGIYCLLNKLYFTGTFCYKTYVWERIRKVAPPYYICVILTVFCAQVVLSVIMESGIFFRTWLLFTT